MAGDSALTCASVLERAENSLRPVSGEDFLLQESTSLDFIHLNQSFVELLGE